MAAARLRNKDISPEDVRIREKNVITAGKNQVVPAIKSRAVGKSMWDVDGPAKVTGTLKFCDDYEAADFGAEQMP